MTTCLDHAAGRVHVAGASHEPSTDTLRWITAGTRAHELVEALKAALANAEGWQWQAQRLLECISRGEPKETR